MSTIIDGIRHGGISLVRARGRGTTGNDHSPGLIKVDTACASTEPGQPVLEGAEVLIYWQHAEGEDPYVVIEIDTSEAFESDMGEVIPAAYKVYVNDQHVAGAGHD